MLPERLSPPDEPPVCPHDEFEPDCEECSEEQEWWGDEFYDRADREYERMGDR